jgi:hypothetical protein
MFFGPTAEAAVAGTAVGQQLCWIQPDEVGEFGPDRGCELGGDAGRIGRGAAFGLGHDTVNHAEFQQ